MGIVQPGSGVDPVCFSESGSINHIESSGIIVIKGFDPGVSLVQAEYSAKAKLSPDTPDVVEEEHHDGWESSSASDATRGAQRGALMACFTDDITTSFTDSLIFWSISENHNSTNLS
ncbi:hypothetical protein Tco_1353818 [Tanacetum coccineum]